MDHGTIRVCRLGVRSVALATCCVAPLSFVAATTASDALATPSFDGRCQALSHTLLEEARYMVESDSLTLDEACLRRAAEEEFSTIQSRYRDEFPQFFVHSKFDRSDFNQSTLYVTDNATSIPAVPFGKVERVESPNLAQRINRTSKLAQATDSIVGAQAVETYIDPISQRPRIAFEKSNDLTLEDFMVSLSNSLANSGEPELSQAVTKLDLDHATTQSVATTAQNNDIELISLPKGTIKGNGLPHSPDDRQAVEEFEPTARDGYAGGWNFGTCTGGFVIHQGKGHGISTAKHCHENIVKTGYKYDDDPQFKVSFKVSSDPHNGEAAAYWMKSGAGTAYPSFRFKHGEHHSSHREVRATAWTQQGDCVFRYGRRSDRVTKCSAVNETGVEYLGVSNVNKMVGTGAQKGDSGGPIYKGYTAHGLLYGGSHWNGLFEREYYTDVKMLEHYNWHVALAK